MIHTMPKTVNKGKINGSLLYLVLLIFYVSSYGNCVAQTIPNVSSKLMTSQRCKNIGEKIFYGRAAESLAEMDALARKYSQNGVAVIAFAPGENTNSWISRMKVSGSMSNKTHNFLAVASAKATEMALSHEDSGTGKRKLLVGELGYKGGVIRKVKCGYIIASFSGAPSKIDEEISKKGLDILSKYY